MDMYRTPSAARRDAEARWASAADSLRLDPSVQGLLSPVGTALRGAPRPPPVALPESMPSDPSRAAWKSQIASDARERLRLMRQRRVQSQSQSQPGPREEADELDLMSKDQQRVPDLFATLPPKRQYNHSRSEDTPPTDPSAHSATAALLPCGCSTMSRASHCSIEHAPPGMWFPEGLSDVMQRFGQQPPVEECPAPSSQRQRTQDPFPRAVTPAAAAAASYDSSRRELDSLRHTVQQLSARLTQLERRPAGPPPPPRGPAVGRAAPPPHARGPPGPPRGFAPYGGPPRPFGPHHRGPPPPHHWSQPPPPPPPHPFDAPPAFLPPPPPPGPWTTPGFGWDAFGPQPQPPPPPPPTRDCRWSLYQQRADERFRDDAATWTREPQLQPQSNPHHAPPAPLTLDPPKFARMHMCQEHRHKEKPVESVPPEQPVRGQQRVEANEDKKEEIKALVKQMYKAVTGQELHLAEKPSAAEAPGQLEQEMSSPAAAVGEQVKPSAAHEDTRSSVKERVCVRESPPRPAQELSDRTCHSCHLPVSSGASGQRPPICRPLWCISCNLFLCSHCLEPSRDHFENNPSHLVTFDHPHQLNVEHVKNCSDCLQIYVHSDRVLSQPEIDRRATCVEAISRDPERLVAERFDPVRGRCDLVFRTPSDSMREAQSTRPSPSAVRVDKDDSEAGSLSGAAKIGAEAGDDDFELVLSDVSADSHEPAMPPWQ